MAKRLHTELGAGIRLLSLVALVLAIGCPAVRAEPDTKDILRFAAEMAKKGNWREANYRWKQATRLLPQNAKVLNNLAVSEEALGRPDEARAAYDRAADLARDDRNIGDNRRRFERFWREKIAGGEDAPEPPEAAALAEGKSKRKSKRKTKGKTMKVTVSLPVPAKLDLDGAGSLLVASFLTRENALIDTNRELVRFLRSEFHKNTELDVLDVTPPPAIPEQTVEDLLANREFWKHLGREYGADVVVSGIVRYERLDSSGFRDVDVVSPTTGQKVRRTEFVEQERFNYELDIFFMDGATGTLRFRDRIQRAVVFRGSQNDPITAFYELSESIATEVLAIVRPRLRDDIRVIFRS